MPDKKSSPKAAAAPKEEKPDPRTAFISHGENRTPEDVPTDMAWWVVPAATPQARILHDLKVCAEDEMSGFYKLADMPVVEVDELPTEIPEYSIGVGIALEEHEWIGDDTSWPNTLHAIARRLRL